MSLDACSYGHVHPVRVIIVADLIDLSCCDVVVLGKSDVQEALIVAQVQVTLKLGGRKVRRICMFSHLDLCMLHPVTLPRHHHPARRLRHARTATWCRRPCSSKDLRQISQESVILNSL